MHGRTLSSVACNSFTLGGRADYPASTRRRMQDLDWKLFSDTADRRKQRLGDAEEDENTVEKPLRLKWKGRWSSLADGRSNLEGSCVVRKQDEAIKI